MRKIKKGPPAKHYLVPVKDDFPRGDRCEHKEAGGGRWLVEWEGKLYQFEHATQMQKDIWLDQVRNEGRYEEAVKALRWFCFECGTVQMP